MAHRPPESIKFPMPVARHDNKKNPGGAMQARGGDPTAHGKAPTPTLTTRWRTYASSGSSRWIAAEYEAIQRLVR